MSQLRQALGAAQEEVKRAKVSLLLCMRAFCCRPREEEEPDCRCMCCHVVAG